MQSSRQLTRSDFSAEQAEEIAGIAETQGWQVAAHDYMRVLDHAAYRLAIDGYRGQLRFLLPLTPDSLVLQLRCGWGPVAISLAEYVGSVVALDDRLPRLRFASARQKQMNLSTLHNLCASISPCLPFAAGVFDAVIMLDALERPGISNPGMSGGAQVTILNEVKRVLKPSGWLLLGAANRLGLGRPKSDQAERICTFWGYRQLLRAAGFASPQFHSPLPSHLEPFLIMPLDHPEVLSHFIGRLFTSPEYQSKLKDRGLSSVFRLASLMWRAGRRLRLTGLAQLFVPSYLIMAQKGEP